MVDHADVREVPFIIHGAGGEIIARGFIGGETEARRIINRDRLEAALGADAPDAIGGAPDQGLSLFEWARR